MIARELCRSDVFVFIHKRLFENKSSHKERYECVKLTVVTKSLLVEFILDQETNPSGIILRAA